MTVSTGFSDEYKEEGTKVDKDKALLMPCYVEEKDEKVGQQLWEEDQTARAERRRENCATFNSMYM